VENKTISLIHDALSNTPESLHEKLELRELNVDKIHLQKRIFGHLKMLFNPGLSDEDHVYTAWEKVATKEGLKAFESRGR
jgi:hypothetical protein